jgi:hypothetical protein
MTDAFDDAGQVRWRRCGLSRSSISAKAATVIAASELGQGRRIIDLAVDEADGADEAAPVGVVPGLSAAGTRPQPTGPRHTGSGTQPDLRKIANLVWLGQEPARPYINNLPMSGALGIDLAPHYDVHFIPRNYIQDVSCQPLARTPPACSSRLDQPPAIFECADQVQGALICHT